MVGAAGCCCTRAISSEQTTSTLYPNSSLPSPSESVLVLRPCRRQTSSRQKSRESSAYPRRREDGDSSSGMCTLDPDSEVSDPTQTTPWRCALCDSGPSLDASAASFALLVQTLRLALEPVPFGQIVADIAHTSPIEHVARRLQPRLVLVEQLVCFWVALKAGWPQGPWRFLAATSASSTRHRCHVMPGSVVATLRTLLLDAVPRPDRASTVSAPQTELAVGNDGEAFWLFAVPRDAVLPPVCGLRWHV